MAGIPGLTGLTGLLARIRSLVAGVFGRGRFEAEMDEEFRHHLELRTQHLIRSGLSPEEARRRAHVEFGHVDSHKEYARASRGLHFFDQIRFSWLDVKLGLRVLVRYPALTAVGGLAMGFAIFIGAATFEFIDQMVDPELPLPDGDRIVGIRYWDRSENEEELPLPSDLRLWRDEMRTISPLAGFRTVERNLAAADGAGEPVVLATISPDGLRLARVAPLLGRGLGETDAVSGAPPVVVLGHSVWRTRFGADRGIIGRLVRVGDVRATVVGVMPEGFSFPRNHQAWMPLPGHVASAEGGQEAPLRVFGRLAPGATLEEAEAEAATLGPRRAGRAPEEGEHLAPQVLPFAASLAGAPPGTVIRALLYQVNLLAILFLILVSANVALLLFARAAAREREILVRNALGATRGRILMQLFVEALVLASFATALGLAATEPGLEWLNGMIRDMGGGALPFWFAAEISPAAAVYAGVLTVVGAVVAGVVPALKVTGRGMQARLREAGAGAGGLRLGGIWTGIIVTQIAATVVFAGVAYVFTNQAAESGSVDASFPAEEYLGVRVEMDGEPLELGTQGTRSDFLRDYAAHVRELKTEIARDPAVVGVALAERLPLKVGGTARIEVDSGGAVRIDSTRIGHAAYSDAVGVDFFDLFQSPAVAGRAFDTRDLGESANTVIVNASFVEEVLGGRSPLGRRIRYVDPEREEEPGPWHQIVGVVRDLTTGRTRSLNLERHARAHIYHPLATTLAGAYPVHLIARVQGRPGELLPTLYSAARGVSPTLRLHEPLPLDQVNSDLAVFWRLWADLVLVVSGVALFLSLAGIYAILSFTVSRRTREIGVRVALGASAGRVIREIFRNPLRQIVTGVAVGCVLLGAIVWRLTDGAMGMHGAALLLLLPVAILAVCSLACWAPTLRALRVQPMDALSADT